MRFSVKTLFATILVFALTLSALLFLWTKPWQGWWIDSEWATQIIEDAKELSGRLEEFKDQNGRYPNTLNELNGDFAMPTDYYSRDSKDRWRYRKLSSIDYELFVVGSSFVSSYDAMVYRHSGNYPEHWFDPSDSSHAKEFGKWWYITGFSGLEQMD